MKSAFLFFFVLIVTLQIEPLSAGDRFVLQKTDRLKALSSPSQTGSTDSLSSEQAVPYFQISRAEILPDSLVHADTYSFFGGLLPKTKRDYTRSGLMVTAVLSNWVSFYLKRQADTYYGKYRHSVSLKDINYYYDKTSAFDRYSNALLIVSGVALSAYLYLLFSD